jgi:hypothetical protein
MPAITPSDFFPNAQLVAANGTVAAQSIAIPLTDLDGLLAAEADPSTGDGREVVRIFLQTVAAKYASLPTAERPAFMTVTEPALVPLSATRVRKGINMTFDIDVPAIDLQMPTEA